MRLIGLLNFYDEPPEHLAACIVSLRKAGVDHLVALDGAYVLYPDGEPASDPRQLAAIAYTCRNQGMGCTLHVPQGLWEGNEVEKRTFLFYLGLANAEPGDWFMVMDADQVITRIPDDFHERLEKTEREVAVVTFHDESAIYTRRILFVAQPIFVVGNHWTYKTMEGKALWTSGGLPQEEALNLVDFVVLHRPNRRPGVRLDGKKTYYDDRDSSAAELLDCRKCGHDATKRIPTRWRKSKGMVLGDWVEVCDKCAVDIEKVNRVTLRQLGLDPEAVTPRYVLGDPKSQDKHIEVRSGSS